MFIEKLFVKNGGNLSLRLFVKYAGIENKIQQRSKKKKKGPDIFIEMAFATVGPKF